MQPPPAVSPGLHRHRSFVEGVHPHSLVGWRLPSIVAGHTVPEMGLDRGIDPEEGTEAVPGSLVLVYPT